MIKNYQDIEESLSISEGAKYNNKIEELEAENEDLKTRIGILEDYIYKPVTEDITDDQETISSHARCMRLIKKVIQDEMKAATKHLE